MDSPGVGRELFDLIDTERRQLAEWHAEATAVLTLVAESLTIGRPTIDKIRSCLGKNPFHRDV